jgi:hypothetical protein
MLGFVLTPNPESDAALFISLFDLAIVAKNFGTNRNASNRLTRWDKAVEKPPSSRVGSDDSSTSRANNALQT